MQLLANEIEFEEHGGVEQVKMEVSSMENGIHGSLGCGEVGLGCGEVGHDGFEAIQVGGGSCGICH